MADLHDLPEPLVPAHVDLRDVPLPREAFVRLAMDQFDLLRGEAERLVDEVIAQQRGH